ncbi:MAG: hypothetical protein GF355_03125 [Candidatus Eisenbacteria bacterium]|nr:hypothetical protein [Candidatus Eisenbacteria bacterium]
MRRLLCLSCIIVLGLAGWQCEHAEDPAALEDGNATLGAIQQEIFDTSCALSNCHLGDGAPFGLDLSEGEAHGNLAGVSSSEKPSLLRVDPGSPDESYLVHKIEGGPDIVNARMPLGRDPLSGEQIDLIREWIAAGAEDN